MFNSDNIKILTL